MNQINIINLATNIVKEACELKNKLTDEVNAPINYACIFSHSEAEFETLKSLASQIGNIIKETQMGPIFKIKSLDTVSGKLKLLKIRIPHKDRPEPGYADFTVDDYQTFKRKYLGNEHFRLITRKDYEMIELMDSKLGVRTYFAYPPIDKQLGVS